MLDALSDGMRSVLNLGTLKVFVLSSVDPGVKAGGRIGLSCCRC